jgi:glutathione S-transferase
MSTNDITLYHHHVSGPARAVTLLLDYIGNTSVKRQVVDLLAKEQLQEWFVAINPFHTVPTVEDKTNGLVLYESMAILEYFADIFGHDGKYGLPKDTTAKYKVVNAGHNYHNFIAAASRDIMSNWYPALFAGLPFNLEAFKAGVEKASEKFAQFEEILKKNGGYITGTTPTLVDLRVWVDIFQYSNLGGESTLAIIDFSEKYPTTQKWLNDIKADFYTEEKWAPLAGFYGFYASKAGTDYRLTEKK